MNESASLTIPAFNTRRYPTAGDTDSFLELLPLPALILDASSQRVLSANRLCADLTSFTRAELFNLEFYSILQVTQEPGENSWGMGKISRQSLIRIQQSEVEVRFLWIVLPPKGKQILALVEPLTAAPSAFPADSGVEKWKLLQQLVAAAHQPDLQLALRQALQVGGQLLQVSILDVYQVLDQSPELTRCASLQEKSPLPETIPAHEVVEFLTPAIWSSGKRPPSSLHRMARKEGLPFLATVPLGQSNALVGMIVASDTQVSSDKDLLPALQILAETLTAIVQEHSLRSQLNQQLHRLDHMVKINKAMEEAIHEGLLLVGPNLEILRLNPAAEMILGYAGKEVFGKSAENILIGTETLLPALIAAQEGKPSVLNGNVRLYRRYGDAFLANLRAIPVLENEKVEGIIILIEDLSEQEQYQEQARQLEQKALLGEVNAVFAHEVRNPINNIGTSLELLSLHLPQDDATQGMIARMQQDCDRLSELMKTVLAYSKPMDYEMQTLDLGQLVQRLLERLHPRMAKVGVKYHLQVEPNCPQIEGNWKALEQVFNNLITNAVEAMHDGGGILAVKIGRVITAEGRKYLEANVADTGPGIPKELQDRIFTPFFTTNRNGTGLGLAITKRIVTAHKGVIQLESYPGGTVFHIQLPIKE